MEEIRQIARRQNVTVAEWVRRVLRAAKREETLADAGKKLRAVREAVQYNAPTADIEQMLAEIERGYRE